MFLKTLEIFGFKSFADRVRIEFSDGVAALLGPNGCGKSNVVDAMKWVLGEQSSKSLRAEKMEDIIFAGSESRKPLSVAEVGLVLSNEKEILPLDLPEISIRRRLYRSGESEYFINNSPVKLRDVRELFFDTGIGKSAYSIMEQGTHRPAAVHQARGPAAGVRGGRGHHAVPGARPGGRAQARAHRGEHAPHRGHPRGGAAQLQRR